MKFIGTISAVLAAAGIAAAAPTNGAPNTHLNFASGTPSAHSTELDKREYNRGGAFGPFTGLLNGLPAPLSDSLQNAVAEVFKGGDAFLNTPLDAADNIASGNVGGAGQSFASNVGGTLKSLPGDAKKIFGA
ncbi:hypothetical protein QQS21_010342 [Conoideocrella luteorostrata]|uniref:Uncharacterized protein n=1 Tax=Conoideocrella luteorostrata TaxID=1105319 RepID=A0AAJ0CFH7_9HYPO|nr:hypothetical protein QQS21_010342 [Conoideocrella luteorostrata]